MQQSGFLILADISGYTEFLTQTEIDHSTEILHSLIEVLVDETRLPLQLHEIEGDAVFSSAPSDAFERGVLLIDMIESMYAAFRSALRDVDTNSTCECRACASAPDLDLKFIVHHGSFTAREIGGRGGITGPDVVLAHRLLKNRIADETGTRAYAFLTDAAIEALEQEGLSDGMTPHRESYEHLGTVSGVVYDMLGFWEREQATRTVRVPAEGAIFRSSQIVPAALAAAWEAYSNPRHRQVWKQSDSLSMETLTGGRHGPGMVEHCVHGKDTHVHKTLDWKPMRYMTQAIMLPLGGILPYMAEFEPVDVRTRVTVTFGKPQHDRAIPRALLRLMVVLAAPKLRKTMTDGLAKYGEIAAALGAEAAGAEAPAEPATVS